MSKQRRRMTLRLQCLGKHVNAKNIMTAKFWHTGRFKGEREDGHVTEVVSLKQGEWLCYRGEQFNGGRMVMLQFSQ